MGWIMLPLLNFVLGNLIEFQIDVQSVDLASSVLYVCANAFNGIFIYD
jgi:hypothetical protein